MDTFLTGFIFGLIISITLYIFIRTIRRGKTDSPGSLKERVNRNNNDIRSGLSILRDNNKESGKIIDSARDTAQSGLKSIDDTKRTVSEIIAAAKRDGKKESEG